MAEQQKSLRCRIDSPGRVFFDDQAEMCVLPAIDGEWAVYADHAATTLLLGIGGLRIKTTAGWRYFFLKGGVAQIEDNHVVILCEEAVAGTKLVKKDLEESLHALDAVKNRDQINEVKTKLKILERMQAG